VVSLPCGKSGPGAVAERFAHEYRPPAPYTAPGVSRDGAHEVPGLRIADNEGAEFRLSVMNELKNRRVRDMLIAVVDGLKGFPDATTAAFRDAAAQSEAASVRGRTGPPEQSRNALQPAQFTAGRRREHPP
jgi:hypothetical protein